MKIAGKIARRVRSEAEALIDKLSAPVFAHSYVDDLLSKKEADLKANVDHKLFLKTGEYDEYVRAQIHKSYRHSSHVRFWRRSGRTALIAKLDEFLPENRDLTWLCVGCRDSRELGFVQKICGVQNVRGLDLFSTDPRIEVGDMHAMPFQREFDVLISVDNFEHAYDPQKAAQEFSRVVKPGGFIGIEVPVDFPLSATDRHDYKSSENILDLLGLEKDALIYEEYIGGLTNKRKLRMIARNG